MLIGHVQLVGIVGVLVLLIHTMGRLHAHGKFLPVHKCPSFTIDEIVVSFHLISPTCIGRFDFGSAC